MFTLGFAVAGVGCQSSSQRVNAFVLAGVASARVTDTGGSELALLVVKAASSGTVSPTSADARTACGEIDDVLPSYPGTGEYFFLANGMLYLGTLDKGVAKRRITLDQPLRINRLLLLVKSSAGRVLLVEQVSARGEERGALWRLSITERDGKLHATAQRRASALVMEQAVIVARFRRGKGYLRVSFDTHGLVFLDLAPSPGAPRKSYLQVQGVSVERAMFHSDKPDTLLLVASCPEQ